MVWEPFWILTCSLLLHFPGVCLAEWGSQAQPRSAGWKSSVKIPKAALKVSVLLHCSTNQPCHDVMKILLTTPELICPNLASLPQAQTKPLLPSSLLLGLCAVVIHTTRRNSGLWRKKNQKITELLRCEKTSESKSSLQPSTTPLTIKPHPNVGFEPFQGWWFHHFSGQPVPNLDNPFHDEIFPDPQSLDSIWGHFLLPSQSLTPILFHPPVREFWSPLSLLFSSSLSCSWPFPAPLPSLEILQPLHIFLFHEDTRSKVWPSLQKNWYSLDSFAKIKKDKPFL